jgi:hypothetical protein
MTPECPYCTLPAELAPDTAVYGRSYGGNIWLCRKCGAYVGCHKGGSGDKPLGRLADAELRKLKMQCHALFDPLWRDVVKLKGWSRHKARNSSYGWLAGQMNIPREECHIGMFDAESCVTAIGILGKYHHDPA